MTGTDNKNKILNSSGFSSMTSTPEADRPKARRQTSVLCILDHTFCNLMMHYSETIILHPGQSWSEILDLVNKGDINLNGIRLVYLLAGRADCHHAPSRVLKRVEELLRGLQSKSSRVMCLLGSVVLLPSDKLELQMNIKEINLHLAKLAEKDPHWLFCNFNSSLALGGIPQKRFFDKQGVVSTAGCRIVAKSVVAASKGARMQRNFDLLAPWMGEI